MKNKLYISRSTIKRAILPIAAICLSFTSAYGQNGDLMQIKDLSGSWKFSIGDQNEWKQLNYDDSDWDRIKVPASWEEQGFQGYNGFATYRKKFTISKDHEGLMLYLFLGYIDDVDEAYINGKKIGSTGSFPPSYWTAYNAMRKYYIPEDIISFDGENILTVKVYDAQQAGGIVSGKVGIYSNSYGIKPDVNLQGTWKFRTNDNFDWIKPEYNDSNWDEIFVPSKWEDQGYRNYDGFAWYRKTFIYNANLNDENLIMLLGKIDDVDQVYLNGVLIGSTGLDNKIEGKTVSTYDQHKAFRGYYFPSKLLKKNEKNTIAIRVYDRVGEGGIYEGPVGIVGQEKYINFWRKKKNATNW